HSPVVNGQPSVVSRESSVVSPAADSALLAQKSPVTIHDSRFTSHEEFKKLVYSLEKYSNHPIAKAIANEWKTSAGPGGKNEIRWNKIEEVKGVGMKATDKDGNEYWAGSYRLVEK